MKRVLLTGAAGFVGRHAIAPLRKRGFEVHAVSRRRARLDGADSHVADLLDPAQAGSLLQAVKPTHLLHLAWYVEHGRFWNAAENYAWVGASIALLRAFTAGGGRRAVLAGTCAEYDWTGGVCDEPTTKLAPRSDYGVCKNATRALAQAWCAREGASFAWGRIFHLYGPGEPAARFVPSVIAALARGEEARCTQGLQQRDLLHVADAADAFATLLDAPVEGPVNIASGRAVTLAEVAREIARQMGRPGLLRLGALPTPPDDPPVLLADTRRLAAEVGWTPRIPLEEGLQRTIEWWCAQAPRPARPPRA